jgi:hypothetical protein
VEEPWGGGTCGGKGGILGSEVLAILGISVGELTVQAAWVAALAILAVTLAGWRKPARAAPLTPREAPDSAPKSDAQSDAGSAQGEDHERFPVVITTAPLERPPTLLRRVASALSATALSIVTGAVLAILISFGAVIAVIWATNLLGR